MEFVDIPQHKWIRHLNTPDPGARVHTFSRPPILEALSLLPVAYRVSAYLSDEKRNGRDPIFDLSGIALEPPNPGPYAGLPLGNSIFFLVCM